MAKDSSPKMPIPTPSAASTTKAEPKVKPIKLRAACNCCFSAKVRCDGNKAGCQRCSEKKLSCIYSESRVGKVVGRRRKRTLEDAIGTVDSEAWVINQRPLTYSLPSPSSTNYSDESSKRQCSDASWTSFLVDEAREYFELDESTEALQSIDIANRSHSISSMNSIMPYYLSNGLPTPALSPPTFRYLSPASLNARPMSRQTSTASHNSQSRLVPPTLPASVTSTPESSQSGDEETVCIKLLSHLKKHSNARDQDRDFQIDLVKKSNASVRRILQSKNIRGNYTCHMLLSSIITYLVTICEHICAPKSQSHESAFALEPSQSNLEITSATGSSRENPIRTQITATAELTSEIGKLLKRRPHDGFQVLGRHESHHVELDLRLQRALANLDA